MRELKATDKITQKMTRDGAVSENLATGEVEHISSREPETELSASSEESAGAAADLALRAAEHHEKKSTRKAEKADTQAVQDGSAARQRPSSRLQFTEEERADPILGKYIDRSDRAADRLDAAKAAIPTKKVLRTERVFDETAGKGKTQLHFEEVEKRPKNRLCSMLNSSMFTHTRRQSLPVKIAKQSNCLFGAKMPFWRRNIPTYLLY